MRVVDDHEGFGREHARGVPRGDQLVEVRRPHGHRLLAQDVLARLHRLQAPFHVERVGQRDVDRVDARVAEQGVEAVVHPQARGEDAERLGLGRIRCRQRRDLSARRQRQCGPHELPRELGGAQDSPTNFHHDAGPCEFRWRQAYSA